ncbi:heat-inducible transcriptional repressor HrcA [Spiroplasma turonicum]|uniref:Heat-inducible transcription repressor HrcA n=1 Tax=Spiroplasma turonicum TaxID=216946 RepID=A0A0K1P6W8_9MOLU|nr:heat-inducible transcriptional repressor HrcA [Spiroplasma turonicum]AKU80043.1 heat-inducible transcription repressor [Spiroplasma turonicum]ALX71045.1 heat-inducible transcription repressor [Spiroplasma turonicum]
MLSKRQEQILKAIIDEYIKTASPIGSKRIQEIIEIEVSPATIRNESAFLEEQGFIEKAHTSSGRVPSTKGYRYYVDNLMEVNNYDNIKTKIEKIFSKRDLSIDEILDKTSNLISEMTKLATIVVTSNEIDEVKLSKVELIQLTNTKAAVLFVLSNGHIQNKTISLDQVALNDLTISIDLFNERLINSKISEIETKSQVIIPILKKQVKKCEFILQTLVGALIHTESNKSKTSGVKYLLENPEFNDPKKIKSIIEFIETASPFAWFNSQSKKSSKTSVAIGFETGIENDDFAVVKTDFTTELGNKAALALVGPKRIEYDKVSDLLDWIRKKIESKFLGEE